MRRCRKLVHRKVDPQTWLADTIARIPGYKITKVQELFPWN
ncbi:transposase domain-containing protein [Cognatiyoonia sp. IB215182]